MSVEILFGKEGVVYFRWR